MTGAMPIVAAKAASRPTAVVLMAASGAKGTASRWTISGDSGVEIACEEREDDGVGGRTGGCRGGCMRCGGGWRMSTRGGRGVYW